MDDIVRLMRYSRIGGNPRKRHRPRTNPIGEAMKKMFAISMVLTLVLAAAAVAADAPAIIGVPKCKICHGKKTGDQYKIWQGSKHATAFATLGTDAAKEIAAERGLGDPQTEEACLKCHATHAFLGRDVALDPKTKYEVAEGVGCESCHGAGSEYRPKKIMEDREASLAAGLILPTEETCVKCHNEESPTYQGFDFATYYEKIKHPVPEK